MRPVAGGFNLFGQVVKKKGSLPVKLHCNQQSPPLQCTLLIRKERQALSIFVLEFKDRPGLAQAPYTINLSTLLYGKWDLICRRCSNTVNGVLVKVRTIKWIWLVWMECSFCSY